MSASQSISRDHHTAIPAKPDLIRLSIGVIGIGTSGPLIALSGMPILTLIFWRNLGGSLFNFHLHCVMREIEPELSGQ